MNRMDAPCGLLSRHLLFIAMEGLPLDVILLVSIGLVAAVSLAAYLARKFGSNGNQVNKHTHAHRCLNSELLV